MNRTRPSSLGFSRRIQQTARTTTRRAMVAAKMATLKRDANQHTKEVPSIEGTSVVDAAKLLNVRDASFERTKQVIEHGSKALI